MSKEIVHDFGSMKAIFKPSADDTNEGIIEITGMKTKDELPEEYINGYPMCYKYSDCFYMLKDSHGNYCYGDGSIGDDSYSIHIINPRGITQNAFGIVVDKLLACSMRLYEINHRKKETDMFNGLNENVESVVYDFDGCIVKISKTEDFDTFKIEINPGLWEFDVRKLGCERKTYAFEVSWSSDYDWFVPFIEFPYYEHFNNNDKFNTETINTILLNIKSGVDARKELKLQSRASTFSKIKLMTREEMLDFLKEGKLLPSEICKEKYKNFKRYCIENKICSCEEFEDKYKEMYKEMYCKEFSWVDTCALCETYFDCKDCHLNIVDSNSSCGYNSTFNKMKYCDGHDKFIQTIDNMILILDKAIEYERDMKRSD